MDDSGQSYTLAKVGVVAGLLGGVIGTSLLRGAMRGGDWDSYIIQGKGPARKGYLDTYPGSRSKSLRALNRGFRTRVEKVVAAMAKKGYKLGREYRIVETWRSPKRQAYYKRTGASTVTEGFHTATKSTGEPNAYAIDFAPKKKLGGEPKQAQFYHDLWALGEAQDLASGASWSQHGKWAKYGLGWDAGHLETRAVSIAKANESNPKALA